MKRGNVLVGIFFLVIGLCLPTAVMAGGSPYVSAQGGFTFLSDNDAGIVDEISFNTGGFGALAMGYDFGPSYSHARLEAELAYHQNSIDSMTIFGAKQTASGKVRSETLMFNGYYQIDNPSIVKPFIMAGFGLAWLQVDNAQTMGVVVIDGDDVQVGGQAGAGVSFQFNPVFALDLGYKYLWTAKTEFKDEVGGHASMDYQTHNIYAGLRFNF